MKYIKAQLPAPGLSHDGKWAGLACVVAGYGYVVCVERPGVYTGVLGDPGYLLVYCDD